MDYYRKLECFVGHPRPLKWIRILQDGFSSHPLPAPNQGTVLGQDKPSFCFVLNSLMHFLMEKAYLILLHSPVSISGKKMF